MVIAVWRWDDNHSRPDNSLGDKIPIEVMETGKGAARIAFTNGPKDGARSNQINAKEIMNIMTLRKDLFTHFLAYYRQKHLLSTSSAVGANL